jgi:NhaA family Na+:H+ antiporter
VGIVMGKIALAASVIVCLGLVASSMVDAWRPSTVQVTRRIDQWGEAIASGQPMGRLPAKVTIVVLSDFQCPACARMRTTLATLRSRHPANVAIVFHHYPLDTIHPQARMAAIASECAAEQGRFEAFHDAVFARQREIGRRPWDAYASDAGLADGQGFARCLDERRYARRVDRDLALGKSIQIGGTPTVIINGALYARVPTPEELEAIVQAALK